MSKIVRFQTSYAEPYPLEVQGESFYRDNIENISNYMGEDEGVNADDYIARLILEDENIHDRGNAIRVDIAGKVVGHLSKPQARKYRKKLIELGIPDVIGECFASIKGGFIKRDGSQADFGVRLDLDISTMKVVELKPVKVSTAQQVSQLKKIEQSLPIKTNPVQPKKNISFIGFLLIICIIVGAIGMIVDQISLVLENAGYLSTRTPAPTATLNFLDEIHLTSTALHIRESTPTP